MADARPMRRKDRAITDEATIREIIGNMEVLRLGLYDGEEVYVVPVSFGYAKKDGKDVFYFHGSKAGRKADIIKSVAKTGFELDRQIAIVADDAACDHTAHFESIIGHGDIEEITDASEKAEALNIIMEHNTGKGDWELPEKMVKGTFVAKVTADWMTCKVNA